MADLGLRASRGRTGRDAARCRDWGRKRRCEWRRSAGSSGGRRRRCGPCGEDGAVGERERERKVRRSAAADRRRLGCARSMSAEIFGVADGEVDLDGIELRDRREDGLRADQIADLRRGLSGDSADERAHLREAEIQFWRCRARPCGCATRGRAQRRRTLRPVRPAASRCRAGFARWRARAASGVSRFTLICASCSCA